MADSQVSTTTQEVMFGATGQTLVLDYPEELSSIVSVTVYEADGDDTATAIAATSGSPAFASSGDTTRAVCGASQDDPTRIPVNSYAGFVAGRRYQIAGAGLSETFELLRLADEGTDDVLFARHPLVNSYASSSSVVDLRVTVSVDSTWAAIVNNLSRNDDPNPRYRVRWHLALADGSPAIVYTGFDLVRYASASPVGPLDIEAAHEGWLDALGPDHRATQGRAIIREAAQLVRADLYHRRIAERALRNREVHARLITSKVVHLTREQQVIRGAASLEQAEMARLVYEGHLAKLVDTPVLALDRVGGGAASTTRGERLMRR